MKRKIRLLLSALSFISWLPVANAQLGIPLFDLIHDTICKESEFVPSLLATNAKTYRWSFCPPLYHQDPVGTNMGTGALQLNVNNNIHTVKAGDFFYSFTINNDRRVFRYQYMDGLEEDPLVTDFGHFQFSTPERPSGISVVETRLGWHVFIIGTTNGMGRLVRLDFANGLNYPMTGFHAYSVSGILNSPRELHAVVVEDSLRAFTFDNNQFKRLDFTVDLANIAHVENFGHMGGVFSDVSDIAPVNELGNFHFIVTNESTNTVAHITFGNSLLNTPFAANLGDFGGKVDVPTGISVVRNCNDYYGFITNKDKNQWAVLHWPASIAGTPTIHVVELGALLLQPTALSNAHFQDGAAYMHVINSSNTMTRIKYDNCNNASVSGSDQAYPNPVKYNQTGTYPVMLVINEGMEDEKFFCLPITVVEYPSINLTTQDTLICSGDTINMHALTFGTDSITWFPEYNITPFTGNFVKVWPEYSQVYTVTLNFAPNCIIKKDFNIRVDKVIADAGADRTITDGSHTVIGGPNTTLGEHLTYKWTPNAYFESPSNQPITSVRPPQNMTYYLTVTAPSGCSATDSVWISVPCDEIYLPNAFAPSAEQFGLINLQLTQINYFRIYDRWGKEVFSTTDPYRKWNGRNPQGIECEMGVYVWEVDGYCKDTNLRIRKSGNVTLVR